MSSFPIQWSETVTEDDVEAVRVLVAGSGVFSAEEIEVAVELAQDAHAQREHSHYRFTLARQNGALAGYSCHGRIPLTDGRYDLYWIVVEGNCQQQGIARALLQRTEAEVVRSGGRRLYAETSSRAVYAPAQRFYARCGFALLARLEHFYAEGDDKLIFGKALGGAASF